MIRTSLAIIIIIAAIGGAHAQQRTIYDARGNVIARIDTTASGTTTIYDAGGTVVARETEPDLRKPHICGFVGGTCVNIGASK